MAKRQLSGSVSVKNGNWIARFRLPTGLDTRRKLGPAWTKRNEPAPPGYLNERQARMELDKILSKYEGWTADSDPLFKFAAEEFIAWCVERGLKATTRGRYEQILNHDLLPELGNKRLSLITESDMAELREDLAARVSASSLNQTRIVLIGVFKYAMKRRGYRGEDPTRWFDRAKIKTSEDIDVYSPTEVEQLARVTRQGLHRKQEPGRVLNEFEIAERRRNDEQNAVIFKTAAYAGLRMGEIRALRWRDIDFAGAKITVRSSYTDQGGNDTPKSGRARTVPMSTLLATELDGHSRRTRYNEPADLVFCNIDGEVLRHSAIYHRFLDAAAAADLRRLRFHDLRHTFGSTMIQAFSITEVQKMLGHASITTTAVYLHFKPRAEDAARMDALLNASLGADELEQAIEEVPRDAGS